MKYTEEVKKAIEAMKDKLDNDDNSWFYYDEIETIFDLLEKQQKEIESTKKEYYSLINRIENKIDYFDYEFEKAKRKNNNDRADYYWDLIRNFKKLLESEE